MSKWNSLLEEYKHATTAEALDTITIQILETVYLTPIWQYVTFNYSFRRRIRACCESQLSTSESERIRALCKLILNHSKQFEWIYY